MPKLVIQDGEGTREVGLEHEHLVGRLPACDVQLESKDISRRHCRFLEEGQSWFVEDLGSTFGTLVNGRKVTKFELQDGDEVSLGTFTLRFLDSEPAVEESLDDGWGDDDEISLDDRYFLILGGGGRSGEIIDLPEGSTRLGRGAQAVLQIRDASVSGAHADLVRDGDQLSVRDLGSSNGTFVDGERVEESAVASGQVVTFGAVPAVYGVGDPKDFAAPAAVAAPAASAPGSDLGFDDGGFGGEDDFLSGGASTAPKSGSGKVLIFGGLAVVAILGGAVAYTLFFSGGQGGGGLAGGNEGPRLPAYDQRNIVPAALWSFEPAPESDEEPPADAGFPPRWMQFGAPGLIVVEEPSLVRSGESALRLSYSAAEGQEASKERLVAAALARGDKDFLAFPAASKPALRVSLFVSGADAGARPAALVRWVNRDEELIGLDFVRAEGESDGEWTEISGVCLRPTGAVSALVGPALLGRGEAVFDDLSALPVDLPEAREVEIKGFSLSLQAGGQLRLSQVGGVLIDGFEPLWDDGAYGLRERQPKSATGGPIEVAVGEGQSLTSALAIEDTVLTALISGTGLSSARRLQFDLPPSSDGAAVVSLLSKGRGERFFRGFEGREADALIVGRGSRICSMAFVDEAGEPLSLSISGELLGDVLRLTAGWSGAETLQLRVQTDFREANAAALALVRSARTARRSGRPGEALAQAREVLERYPFNDQSLGAANTIVRELEGEARALEASLKQRLDDAVFFKRLARAEDVSSGLEEALKDWQGSKVVVPFQALKTRFDGLVAEDQRARPAEHAQRMLERAEGYRAAGDAELAKTVLSSLIASYPKTPAADLAKQSLASASGDKEDG